MYKCIFSTKNTRAYYKNTTVWFIDLLPHHIPATPHPPKKETAEVTVYLPHASPLLNSTISTQTLSQSEIPFFEESSGRYKEEFLDS